MVYLIEFFFFYDIFKSFVLDCDFVDFGPDEENIISDKVWFFGFGLSMLNE